MPGIPAYADCLDNPNSGVYGTDLTDGEWYYGTTLNRDFEDHRQELGNSLCSGCADSWNTDLVVMWQSILFAEGLLGSTNDIDGKFGSRTKNATAQWQARYQIRSDGFVGEQTWAKADDRLYWSVDGWYVIYNAGAGFVKFIRGGNLKRFDNGAYQLVDAYSHSTGLKHFRNDSCAPRIKFYQRTNF